MSAAPNATDVRRLGPSARRRLRLIRAVAVLGVAAALATAVLGGSGAPEEPTVEPAVVAPAPAATPAPAPVVPDTQPAVSVRAAPIHVRVPAIRVDAPLVPVGILDGGVMEIPEDVETIGWYDPQPDPETGAGLGVIPGGTGTAVLAGHVDSRSQGRGALYDLRDLAVGDVIELDHADGSSTTWRVSDVVRYAKVTLPYEEVFTWSGPARLALITCGGEFDRTSRSYTDNIVVYAVPVGTPSAPPT
jgi:hypothetical protein